MNDFWSLDIQYKPSHFGVLMGTVYGLVMPAMYDPCPDNPWRWQELLSSFVMRRARNADRLEMKAVAVPRRVEGSSVAAGWKQKHLWHVCATFIIQLDSSSLKLIWYVYSTVYIYIRYIYTRYIYIYTYTHNKCIDIYWYLRQIRMHS